MSSDFQKAAYQASNFTDFFSPKVYCGECMKNRPKAKGKNAKRPVKTKPFQTCLVAGCARSVRTPKSMFQVYL